MLKTTRGNVNFVMENNYRCAYLYNKCLSRSWPGARIPYIGRKKK